MGRQFGITTEELVELHQTREVAELEKFGGVAKVAAVVSTDLTNGLSEEEGDYSDRKARFGENVYPEQPHVGLLQHILEAAKDKTLLILMGVATAQLIVFFITKYASSGMSSCYENVVVGGVEVHEEEEEAGWLEAAAIYISVLIVCLVTGYNDWASENSFRSLNDVKNNRMVGVVRGGKETQISIFSLLVGDVVVLDTGNQVPADGFFLSGFGLEVDESVMTGEPDDVKKNTKKPFMLSGCQVKAGVGRMVVTAVGVHSEWGQTLEKLVDSGDDATPLQEKLGNMADAIGRLGLMCAVLTFVATMIVFIVTKGIKDNWTCSPSAVFSEVINGIIIAISVVVVAVPEGLPLAVTISLAYSMQKMLVDKNLVRHLAACETMGGATNICSDKTGTLTENKMTVVKGWFAGTFFAGDFATEFAAAVPAGTAEILGAGIAVNTNANLAVDEDGKEIFSGNKTECALLVMARRIGIDYAPIRKDVQPLQMYSFSSERKRMSVVVPEGEGSRVYCKGASEIVVELCTSCMTADGVVAMTPELKQRLLDDITQMASSGLRTICLGYRDFAERMEGEAYENPNEEGLTCIAIVGIKDPLRKEVPAAVLDCQKAGIMVRMVTGDNILTAKHIAKECGILTDGIAIEGPVFRKMSFPEMDAILPRLQVMARSSPTDKYVLVKRLRDLGEVVAVTGDGTNDAPALKEADIGLSMGISGTEVAKEASDVIIMDDNFSSIVKAVLWGRNVYDSVRKFLQFQLTVNIVAVTITFVAAVSPDVTPPLNAVQLLWVNLIMDSLGALALSTEYPLQELLDRKPYGRNDQLISRPMWRNILCHAFYQLVVLFVMLYKGKDILPDMPEGKTASTKCLNTIIFNAFVFCQIFNEVNSRRINALNVFQGIHKNYLFLLILAVTIGMQAMMVELFRDFVKTVHLTGMQWLVCLLIGAASLPVGFIGHLIKIEEAVPVESACTPSDNAQIKVYSDSEAQTDPVTIVD